MIKVNSSNFVIHVYSDLGRSETSVVLLFNLLFRGFSWTRCLEAAIEKFGALSYSKIDNKFSIVNPFININGTDIPSLINESNRFRVLGKQYPTNVCDSLQVSNFVKNKVESMITHVNNQTILPAMKAKIIELCFPQFLRWFLQVHEISITFYRGRNITVVDKSS
ncbi:hypothetical protein RCL1_008958 [Eukaryota sp. TZLM3-RCL]